MYSVIDSNGVLFTSNMNKVTYAWYIFKKYKNGAFVNVTKNNIPKTGQSVPYSFGYNVEYRLDIYKLEKELLTQKDKASFVASYFVNPTKKSSKAEIKKVVIYNKGAKNVDLAGIGNSLTVRVECINMVNKQVKVHVWNAENKSESNFINADIKSEPNLMNSRLIDINEKGIGLTQFNVMQLLSPSESMNLMIGNIKAIGFFVTATYEEQSVNNKAPVVVVSQYQSMADIFESARSMSSYNDINTPERSTEGKCPNCEKDITISELQQIYPKATDSRLKDLAKIFNKYKKHYKLDTCTRKAHFFAQSIQEVGLDLEPGLRGESFNYYKDNLAISLKAFETEEGKRIAKTYGRKETSGASVPEANQIVLANYAYGYQYDTGKDFRNTGKNDGWNFRGRGLLQITGRSNYEAIQKRIDKFASDENVNIFKKYDNPNKAISIDEGYMSATEATLTGMADWYKDDMFVQADKTGTKPDDDVVDLVTNIINKRTNSKQSRRDHYQKTKVTFTVDNCKNINKEVPKSNSNGKWRTPIDNPMLCLYSQGGVEKPWHGSFGEKIRDNSVNHSGCDLFALPGTPVYACIKGKIDRVYTSTTLAGNTVVIEITDKEIFNSLRRSYTPLYKNKGEILEKGFKSNKSIFLVFMHLSKFGKFKTGDIVEYNDIIGYTGISGKNGKNFTTRNPHLHFEINNVGSAGGLDGKCNPMLYFKFKTENELSETEKNNQLTAKNKEWS